MQKPEERGGVCVCRVQLDLARSKIEKMEEAVEPQIPIPDTLLIA